MGDRTAFATGSNDDLCHHDRGPPAPTSYAALALVHADQWLALHPCRLPIALDRALVQESGSDDRDRNTRWTPTGEADLASPVKAPGGAFADRSGAAFG